MQKQQPLSVARPTAFAASSQRAAFTSPLKLLGAFALSAVVANCSQNPQNSRLSSQESREVGSFSHRKYGSASPRLVTAGEAVPKGGGREHVGRAYTVAGKRYTPYDKPVGYVITGQASWYGPAFHGRKTANGEIYDRHAVSAAHPTMPLPSYARVTNTGNSRSIIVRVNDRGPFHGGRVIDLSQRTADLLEFRHLGTARVKVEYLGRASLRGSDDRMLVASLKTDGSPASIPGMSVPATLVANAPPLTSPRRTPATSVMRDAPVEAVTAASTPVVRASALAQPVESAPGEALMVRSAPRPPERPFDLATIPGAGVPTAFAGSAPLRSGAVGGAPRPIVASLFFAPPIAAPQRFDSAHPLARDLLPQNFVALR